MFPLLLLKSSAFKKYEIIIIASAIASIGEAKSGPLPSWLSLLDAEFF